MLLFALPHICNSHQDFSPLPLHTEEYMVVSNLLGCPRAEDLNQVGACVSGGRCRRCIFQNLRWLRSMFEVWSFYCPLPKESKSFIPAGIMSCPPIKSKAMFEFKCFLPSFPPTHLLFYFAKICKISSPSCSIDLLLTWDIFLTPMNHTNICNTSWE